MWAPTTNPDPDSPTVTSGNSPHVSMTSSCAATVLIANDAQRRLRLHRQRNRWHRCVLRRQHRHRQRTADMDLLDDRLIQENRRELGSSDMTESFTPPPIASIQ
jgi:hypothetical protein